MTSLSLGAFSAPPRRVADRRVIGVTISILLHLLLIAGWTLTRTAPPVLPDAARLVIRLIATPPATPTAVSAVVPSTRASAPQRAARARTDAPATAARVATAVTPPAAEGETPVAPAPAPSATLSGAAPASGPDTVLERARRSVGGIDRALRRQNQPYITAPPDSPQLRLRDGLTQAHALAPTKLWEAPKVDELVNQTTDGARRTRVITGRGTYCVSERSPATNVEMIEMHGKLRLTNCPQHESTARAQEWRTARD